jgi:hypothetical protein
VPVVNEHWNCRADRAEAPVATGVLGEPAMGQARSSSAVTTTDRCADPVLPFAAEA